MEEILASIRKIIAEDSSGLRTSTAAARPGAPYNTPSPKAAPLPTSSPQPRSGFMTREAFLKSSQPVEPEPASEYHAPVGTPSRAPAGSFAVGGPSSRLSRDDARSPKPSFPMRESAPAFREQETARAKDTLRVKEDVPSAAESRPKETTLEPVEKQEALTASPERPTPAPDEIIAIDAASVETVTEEVASVEEVSPIAEDDVPTTTIADESERNAPKLAAESASDTARIEAQLSELLSEDLNALREGRTSSPTDAAADDRKDAKAFRNEKRETAPTDSDASTDTTDPFAFDLGPSPFAAKSEPPRPAPAASAAVSPSSAPSPSSPFDVPSSAGFARTTGHVEMDKPKNGSAVSPPAPGFAASDRISDIAPSPEATPAKSRPTFAFPSVSATLGPSRKLEPLSNAFQPAPPPEPFIPVAEVVPEPVRAPESDRLKETPPQHEASDRNEEAASHSMLPATTSDGPDRAMEDAVADLLRPLLKTWLAENMPKIVERALRREMSERLLPNQKSPKD